MAEEETVCTTMHRPAWINRPTKVQNDLELQYIVRVIWGPQVPLSLEIWDGAWGGGQINTLVI